MPSFSTLTQSSSQLTAMVTNINWLVPSWDLFILLFFIIASLLYGFSLGRERIMAILVAVYVALAIVKALPFTNDISAQIGIQKVFLFQIFSFLGAFVILFFFLSRSILLSSLERNQRGSWWQIFFFSFLHVGLIIAVILSFLPREAITALAPWTQQVFVSDVGYFVWIVAPVLAMMLATERDDIDR